VGITQGKFGVGSYPPMQRENTGISGLHLYGCLNRNTQFLEVKNVWRYTSTPLIRLHGVVLNCSRALIAQSL
jgi:hypothetical protein